MPVRAGQRDYPTARQVSCCTGLLGALEAYLLEQVVWLTPDGKVLYCTEKLSQCFPCLSEGNYPRDRALPDTLREYLERMTESPDLLPAEHLRFTLQKPGSRKECKFSATICPVFDADGSHTGYVIAASRLADRIGLRPIKWKYQSGDGDNEDDQQEMVGHEKMVALGTLTAGVAHEIGNPLASLSAVVQLLKRRCSTGEVAEHLNTLDEQINRIARIVRQMLEFSRPSPEELVPTDLGELVERTVRMVCYSQRARDLRIHSRRNRDLPPVRLMPQLFQQVLVNLLLNSLDAVEEKREDGQIWVERAVGEERVRVMVKDTGVGMNRRQVERAFEPFYTTKSSPRGTGLGLAVSYRLVQRQGGDITIESAPGEGTTVTVSFPLEHSAE